MNPELTFITSNAAKAEQIGQHLDFPVTHKKLDLPEIQSLDLREVVEYKAKEAFKEIQGPVLVEDTSLIFKAFGRLPGPLIKWFLAELENEGLCKLLEGRERTALAEVCFGYFDGKNLKFFEGQIQGNIAEAPRGGRGFGWDSIFIPDGFTKTWGKMTPKEQQNTSIRRIALKKLELFLRSQK